MSQSINEGSDVNIEPPLAQQVTGRPSCCMSED